MKNIEKNRNLVFPFRKYLLVFVITGVFIVIIGQKILDNKNSKLNRTECNTLLNKKISGVISNAFYNENINVKSYVIVFTSGEKYVEPIFLTSLNKYVEVGDSICKRPGSFTFEIFKKSDQQRIIVSDSVECEKLAH